MPRDLPPIFFAVRRLQCVQVSLARALMVSRRAKRRRILVVQILVDSDASGSGSFCFWGSFFLQEANSEEGQAGKIVGMRTNGLGCVNKWPPGTVAA